MKALWGHLSRLIASLLLGWLVSGPAAAGTPVQTCIAPLHAANAGALKYSCQGKQRRFGAGDFGVQLRFAPVFSHAEDPLVLRHTSVWQEGERVVFRYADGTTSTVEFASGSARPFMTIGAIFEFKVPPRAAPLDGIYIETRGSANWRGVLLGPELIKHSESEDLQRWLVALYAAFGGLSLALLAYNMALWAVLRHRFQLSYAAMVAAMMAYTFTSSSLVMKFMPLLENNDRLRLNYVFLALTAVCGLRFMQDFFGPKVIGSRLRAAIGFVSAASLVSALAFALFAPRFGLLLDRLYFACFMIMIALVVPIIWSAWRARVHYFWLFLLVWSAPIGVSVMRSAHGLGLVPYSFWLDNGNLIALSIEALLSTALIVTRLRELSSERDAARAGEQSALRLANSDPLTGLLNRRAFIQLAIGRGNPHRLMLIDVDHFKAINDRLGHDAGDEVLRALVDALQGCRPRDSLAVRLGGEEFALLIPLDRVGDCPPERLLDAVRQRAMPLDWKVTVSLGFADGRIESEEDWKRLYRLADSALYRAKADGRNRACRATDFSTMDAIRA